MSNGIRMLAVHTEDGLYRVSENDQRRIVTALTGEADRLVTQSKGHRWQGEGNRKYRAAMREEARRLRLIAVALNTADRIHVSRAQRS